MKHPLIFCFLLVSLSLFSCEQGNVELDNAGDQTLKVVVDELLYMMPAGGFERIELKPGLHSLIVQDASGQVMYDTTFQVVEGGLINLAQVSYYIWVDLYGDATLRETQLNEDWISIGNESFFGQFEEVAPGPYYIERRWDFGLDEDFW